MALPIGLLKGPRGSHFLMNQVSLYQMRVTILNTKDLFLDTRLSTRVPGLPYLRGDVSKYTPNEALKSIVWRQVDF